MSFDPAIQPLGIIKKSSDMLSEISRIEKDDIVTEKNKSGILDLFILLCPSILKSFV